jgi:hypothetical protein
VELYLHCIIRLHGMVINLLSPGEILPFLTPHDANKFTSKHVRFT